MDYMGEEKAKSITQMGKLSYAGQWSKVHDYMDLKAT